MGGIGLQEVVQMLIDGGYLRAKIRGISEFDIIAGGLAWCVLNSRFSIDVEFVENAAIRDKVRIAENITNALKEDMKCPHDLRPHQIQGLDFPKIAVVLEWLLKRVAAAREENAHSVREFTKLDFARRFGCPIPKAAQDASSGKRVLTVPEAIVRSYRKHPNQPVLFSSPMCWNAACNQRTLLEAPARTMITTSEGYSDRVEHASSVLLEYGLKYQIKDSVLLLQHAEALDGDAEMQGDLTAMQNDEEKEQAMLNALLGQMSTHKEKQKMSNTQMNQVMSGGDSNKLAKMRQAYEARKEELMARLAEEEQERNAVDAQRARVAELEVVNEAEKDAIANMGNELESIEADAAKKTKQQNKARKKLETEENAAAELENMIRSNDTQREQYDELLAINEKLKKQKSKTEASLEEGKTLVAQAKEEISQLQVRLADLQSDDMSEKFDREAAKFAELEDQLKQELALKDQEAMDALRQIDGFPNRAELAQYEKRIDELNEEVAWKFEETRHTVNQYNTQMEVAKAIENEEEVMTSIQQLFQICMKAASKKSVPQRDQLLEYCKEVRGMLDASREKLEAKIEAEKGQLKASKAHYDDLMEQQKEHAENVKRIKEMMDDNLSLRNRIREVQAQEIAENDDEI